MKGLRMTTEFWWWLRCVTSSGKNSRWKETLIFTPGLDFGHAATLGTHETGTCYWFKSIFESPGIWGMSQSLQGFNKAWERFFAPSFPLKSKNTKLIYHARIRISRGPKRKVIGNFWASIPSPARHFGRREYWSSNSRFQPCFSALLIPPTSSLGVICARDVRTNA